LKYDVVTEFNKVISLINRNTQMLQFEGHIWHNLASLTNDNNIVILSSFTSMTGDHLRQLITVIPFMKETLLQIS